MSDSIAGFSKAFDKKGKTYTVVHRDCDAVEPAHIRAASDLENELRNAGVKRPIAATPAWEIEAWWMLFPEALHKVRPSWRKVDYKSQNVGMFVNAKERLTQDLRPTSAKDRAGCPDYSERDGIRIAQIVCGGRSYINDVSAKSDSFLFFSKKIKEINDDED